MLHIILFILKISGFIIVGILGLIMLVTAICILSPFAYHIEASVNNSPESVKTDIRFHWLFHLIAGRVSYKNGTLVWSIRAAWKHFGNGRPPAEPHRSPPVSPKRITTEQAETEPAGTSAPDTGTSDRSAEDRTSSDKAAAKTEKKQEKHNNSKISSKQKTTETDKTAENSFISRIIVRVSKYQKKIEYTFQKICAKIKALLKAKEQIEAFVQNQVHQNAFRRILRELRRLIRKLRPKRADVRAEFGFQNPAYTGYLLAGISIIYPAIGDFTEIEPDFEHRVFKGEARISGSLRILHAAVFALRIIADKNVRTTFRHIRKFRLN